MLLKVLVLGVVVDVVVYVSDGSERLRFHSRITFLNEAQTVMDGKTHRLIMDPSHLSWTSVEGYVVSFM